MHVWDCMDSSSPSLTLDLEESNAPVNNGDDKEKADKAFVDSLPPGFQFNPSDQDLVGPYLSKKIMNPQSNFTRIREVDIYDKALLTPEKLTEKYELIKEKEKAWYFLTPTYKKYPKGRRPNRRTDEGYWKTSGKDSPVTAEGRTIGTKRILSFYDGKRRDGKKTDWMMHEFRVKKDHSCSSDDAKKLDEWVLCKVYKKSDGTKKRKGDSIDTPTDASFSLQQLQKPAQPSEDLQFFSRDPRIMLCTNLSPQQQPGQPNHCPLSKNLSPQQEPLQQTPYLNFSPEDSQLPDEADRQQQPIHTNQDFFLDNLDIENTSWQDMYSVASSDGNKEQEKYH